MDRQQRPPVQSALLDASGRITVPWQAWLRGLSERIDEQRKRPYAVYTGDTTLTTYAIGKSVAFSITGSATCTMPEVEEKDLWSWIQIYRIGYEGTLDIVPPSGTLVERIGTKVRCADLKRYAANLTLQLVETDRWAIVGGTGIWQLKPY